jgi:hypothetical protein
MVSMSGTRWAVVWTLVGFDADGTATAEAHRRFCGGASGD